MDGKRKSLEPWNHNFICIKPAGVIGEIQPAIEDSELIEEENVDYMNAGGGIRIAKWRTRNPLVKLQPNIHKALDVCYLLSLKLVLSSVYRCVALRKRKYQPMQMEWHVPIGLNPNLRAQQLLK